MTVQELIDKLTGMGPENYSLQIRTEGCDGCEGEIVTVVVEEAIENYRDGYVLLRRYDD